jgi:hypothetical protein
MCRNNPAQKFHHFEIGAIVAVLFGKVHPQANGPVRGTFYAGRAAKMLVSEIAGLDTKQGLAP